MLRFTLRNLVARKVRLALSGFAIVLGVAFVAGSFIFTDALGGAFNGIIEAPPPTPRCCPREAATSPRRRGRAHDPCVVDATPGRPPEVAAANGTDQVQGVFVIGADGELVGGNGPPGLAFNYTETQAITGDQITHAGRGRAARRGRARSPSTRSTADEAGYEVGDQVELVDPGRPAGHDGDADGTGQVRLGGWTGRRDLTIFDDQAIQDLFFDGRDVYTGISYRRRRRVAGGAARRRQRGASRGASRPGRATTSRRERGRGRRGPQLHQHLPARLRGDRGRGRDVPDRQHVLDPGRPAQPRAGPAASTSAPPAAGQRVRSFRGPRGRRDRLHPRPRRRLPAGVGLRALFAMFGLDLGAATLRLEPRTIAISYAVGVVVTLVAAYLPARRAARIAPVAAMRDDVALPESSLRRRLVVGVPLVAGGIGGDGRWLRRLRRHRASRSSASACWRSC